VLNQLLYRAWVRISIPSLLIYEDQNSMAAQFLCLIRQPRYTLYIGDQ
jgi:hypothetical protein